ncbi:MAG TPA: tRNA (guanosine(37)-N1)-methyltransferase TrmD, partial [Gammaproteobacteria bacterium]|nr:tRNA (guanosine(37)-N1)-methyltransferase TrmD [Gammaproteobacteria bacterium]
AGMVMMADPLRQALDAAKARAPQAASAKCPVVLMSPQGAQFDQERALQT